MKTVPENRTVLLSRKSANSRLVSSLPESVKVLDEENLTLLPKAIKNPVEVENERIAHIKDGVAVTKFIYWLKKNVGKTTITELSAADHLFSLRKEQENFLDNSFDPIVSYAVMRQSATTARHRKQIFLWNLTAWRCAIQADIIWKVPPISQERLCLAR